MALSGPGEIASKARPRRLSASFAHRFGSIHPDAHGARRPVAYVRLADANFVLIGGENVARAKCPGAVSVFSLGSAWARGFLRNSHPLELARAGLSRTESEVGLSPFDSGLPLTIAPRSVTAFFYIGYSPLFRQ